MSKRLLANPTKDNYTVTVEEQKWTIAFTSHAKPAMHSMKLP
jgi:hypothetical protein